MSKVAAGVVLFLVAGVAFASEPVKTTERTLKFVTETGRPGCSAYFAEIREVDGELWARVVVMPSKENQPSIPGMVSAEVTAKLPDLPVRFYGMAPREGEKGNIYVNLEAMKPEERKKTEARFAAGKLWYEAPKSPLKAPGE